MRGSAPAAPAHTRPTRRPPKPSVLWALGVAGGAAAASSFALALTSDAVNGELGEPLVVAILVNWLTLSYVLCGLLAWSLRPASRFGPLMVAAGFVNFVSTLSWTSNDVTFTVGQALDCCRRCSFYTCSSRIRPAGSVGDWSGASSQLPT